MEVLSAGRTECQFDQTVGSQYLTSHPHTLLEELTTLFASVFEIIAGDFNRHRAEAGLGGCRHRVEGEPIIDFMTEVECKWLVSS